MVDRTFISAPFRIEHDRQNVTLDRGQKCEQQLVRLVDAAVDEWNYGMELNGLLAPPALVGPPTRH